jgi:hypothetical protein
MNQTLAERTQDFGLPKKYDTSAKKFLRHAHAQYSACFQIFPLNERAARTPFKFLQSQIQPQNLWLL